MAEMGFDRFIQRGPKVVYHYPAQRDVDERVNRWSWQGLEFETAEIATTAEFSANRFWLHFFETEDEASGWLRGAAHHGRDYHDCADCEEARLAHDSAWESMG